MHIEFTEEFELSPEQVFEYFETPAAWVKLYGLAGEVGDRGDGWYAVPLHRFPFPLVARNTRVEPDELVHWIFRGFWRGEGEVRLTRLPQGVRLEGYEDISMRWLPLLGPLLERLFLQQRFERIWSLGWQRLRRRAAARPGPA